MQTSPSLSLDRPRTVWQIVARALALYRRYPWLFLLLAAPIVAAYDLAILAIFGEGPLVRGGHRGFGPSLLVTLVDYSLLGPLISALHTHAVVQAGEGVEPRLGSVARRGLAVLPVVAAATIMAGIGIGIGFLALVIPGIVLWLRWAVVAPVAAVENEGWLPALSRSRQLTAGNYGHVFGLFALGAAANVVLRIPAAMIPLGGSSGAWSVMLGIAIDTLTRSWLALTAALLYFDLRARRSQEAVETGPASELS